MCDKDYELFWSRRWGEWRKERFQLNQVKSLFRGFVRENKYRTEAEIFGWSFVFEDFVSDELRNKATQQMKVRKLGFSVEGMGMATGHRVLWDMG